MTREMWSAVLAIATVLAVIAFLPPKQEEEELSFGGTAQEIAQLQEAYYAKEGKYLQILEGGKLPHYETGNIAQKLGVPVDAKYAVDVYESPNGRGYRIRWEDENGVYSVGYGANAEEYTFTTPKELKVSTST